MKWGKDGPTTEKKRTVCLWPTEWSIDCIQDCFVVKGGKWVSFPICYELDTLFPFPSPQHYSMQRHCLGIIVGGLHQSSHSYVVVRKLKTLNCTNLSFKTPKSTQCIIQLFSERGRRAENKLSGILTRSISGRNLSCRRVAAEGFYIVTSRRKGEGRGRKHMRTNSA